MPITRTCSIIPLGLEKKYRIFWDDALVTTIRDILSTPNPFFTETSIQVAERLTINCLINFPEEVDVDFNWPEPHYYIGNWQIAGRDGLYSGCSDDEGYITKTTTIIEKRSTITIAADPNQLSTVEGNIKIEQCNYRLIPELKIIPPVVTPVLTYLPQKSEPQFEGFLQRVPPQLLDQYFQPQISAALVSQRPGCDIFDATYEIAPINNVFIAEPAYVLPTCSLPEDTPCDEQFENYITFNNSGRPIDDPIGEYFSTSELCVFASGGAQCRQEFFTCDNGDTRQFWSKINL